MTRYVYDFDERSDRGRELLGGKGIGLALFVFYGLFTPVWFGLRSLAWLAEYRARRRR